MYISIGLAIRARTNYAFFDCLIIAGAIEAECGALYTEDLHAEHEIDGLKIVNPYA